MKNPDFDMVSPLKSKGTDFPCKGYLDDLGRPEGGSTKTFVAGRQATFQTEGNATHNGGSCQVSLSFDQGTTWKVIKSFIGNCVRSAGGNAFDANQVYNFTIPAEAKAGDAIWAWTWFNQSGNREMYMNCAHITIEGSGTSTLNDHPNMFVANVNNGLGTVEDKDVEFPDLGEDVERHPATNGHPTAHPVCVPVIPTPEPDTPPATYAPTPPATCASTPPARSASTPPATSVSTPPATSASTPPAISAPTPGGRTHTVQSGEICVNIAKANGITLEALLAANPEINSGCTNLRVGQNLNLRRRSRIMRRIA